MPAEAEPAANGREPPVTVMMNRARWVRFERLCEDWGRRSAGLLLIALRGTASREK